MADYDILQLAGRHVPEPNSGPFATMDDAAAAGYDSLVPVTGIYEFGAIVNGAFIVLVSEKAGLVLDKINQAQAPPQEPAPEPTPAVISSPPPAQTDMQTGQTETPAEPQADPAQPPQG